MTDTLEPAVASFDAWAEVYEAQANPLLALEQRILASLLPQVRGLDVVDAGCGTGRWLEHFAEHAPRSLIGVDTSPEMLGLAERRLGGRGELRSGSCTALPVADESIDLSLSSFVLSYIENVEAFAAEMGRVLRPGGSFFLSDMHPATEALLGWKRSFTLEGATTAIRSQNWPLASIVCTFEQAGFRLVTRCEPGFGSEEKALFASRGKAEQWLSASGHPAIYILKWRKPATAPRLRRSVSPQEAALSLRGARIAIDGEQTEEGTLAIVNGRIRNRASDRMDEIDVDLPGCILLPGLINAHDHLEFGLFPRLGNGPYENAGQWATDIHLRYADEIAHYRKVPRATAVRWGAIRNLLCGATTVCHHNPLSPDMAEAGFPVRVVKDFAWAHSCALEPQLAEKFAAGRPDLPFILHAAEGVDEQSSSEIFALDQMHVLDRRTLLVHCLAGNQEAAALINSRRATVVLCPTSNQFLFQRIPALKWVRSLQSVILGSDSPLTAAGDLLDEIRFAHQQVGIDAATLYGMVTAGAAQALCLQGGQGTLAPGTVADILVVRDRGLTPSETLVQMTSNQIELVILGGRVQLASSVFLRRLPRALIETLQPLEIDGHVRYIRADVKELLSTAEQCLGGPLRVAGKRVRHASAA